MSAFNHGSGNPLIRDDILLFSKGSMSTYLCGPCSSQTWYRREIRWEICQSSLVAARFNRSRSGLSEGGFDTSITTGEIMKSRVLLAAAGFFCYHFIKVWDMIKLIVKRALRRHKLRSCRQFLPAFSFSFLLDLAPYCTAQKSKLDDLAPSPPDKLLENHFCAIVQIGMQRLLGDPLAIESFFF